MTTRETNVGEPGLSPALALGPIAAAALVVGTLVSGASAQTVWYVIRASGVVAYGLLAASVVIGLLITNRLVRPGRSRVDLYEVHTFTSLLALAFITVHGAMLLLDTFVGFSPVQVLVPFMSSYRPLAVGLGIISGYVAFIVYASFWLRSRIGYKAWRAIHYLTFGGFFMATFHGLLAGTDSASIWMTVTYFGCTAVVLGLTAMRFMVEPAPAKASRS